MTSDASPAADAPPELGRRGRRVRLDGAGARARVRPAAPALPGRAAASAAGRGRRHRRRPADRRSAYGFATALRRLARADRTRRRRRRQRVRARTSCTARSPSRPRSAGKHVWVEKPAGRHLDDTIAIAAAVHAAGSSRPSASTTATRRRSSAPARLVAVGSARRRSRRSSVSLLSDYAAHPDGALSWRFDPEFAGTGVLGDLASHGLDLAATSRGADRRDHRAGRRPGDVHHRAPEPSGRGVALLDGGRTASSGRSATRTRSRRCCASVGRPRLPGVLARRRRRAVHATASRSAAQGRAGLGLPPDEELQVCLDQDYQDAAWQTRLVTPGHGRAGGVPARRRASRWATTTSR